MLFQKRKNRQQLTNSMLDSPYAVETKQTVTPTKNREMQCQTKCEAKKFIYICNVMHQEYHLECV